VEFGNGGWEIGVRPTDLVYALSGHAEHQSDLVDTDQIVRCCHSLTLSLTCDNKR